MSRPESKRLSEISSHGRRKFQKRFLSPQREKSCGKGKWSRKTFVYCQPLKRANRTVGVFLSAKQYRMETHIGRDWNGRDHTVPDFAECRGRFGILFRQDGPDMRSEIRTHQNSSPCYALVGPMSGIRRRGEERDFPGEIRIGKHRLSHERLLPHETPTGTACAEPAGGSYFRRIDPSSMTIRPCLSR